MACGKPEPIKGLLRQFYTLKWVNSCWGALLPLQMQKNNINNFVASEEAAASDITQWLNCIVGNVGTRSWQEKRMCALKNGDIAGSAVSLMIISL